MQERTVVFLKNLNLSRQIKDIGNLLHIDSFFKQHYLLSIQNHLHFLAPS